MKTRERLRVFAHAVLIGLIACSWATNHDAWAQTAAYGQVAPIPPEDARAIEDLIDDQGDLHFVISYPTQAGIPAHRTAFTHIEDHAAVDGNACTIVTRVLVQKGSIPAAHYRSVFALGDVSHMEITTMSALSSASNGRPSSMNMPQNSADPEIPVVVMDERGDPQQGIFMFRTTESARRFFLVLQRVVPRCGGRNE